ncbi:MAG: M48 family metalloprotease [Ignavibacteria bacterium]|nr:M48 family metalloprotease [Ignavibacteria bacterium]
MYKYYFKSNIYLLIILLLFVSSALIYSCGANLFSVAEDVQLGEDLDKEIQANQRDYPLLKDNPQVTNYVSNMGKYIVNNSPRIQYKNVFPYKFQVINDTIVNAFCTPGGFIYVYTGLMDYVDNEATLAGVIAHEIAHAECRHMTQRLTSYYGVSMLLSLVLGNNPSAITEIAANLFVGLGFLANSRADEYEADENSVRYLMTTKYYPGAITYFFKKALAEQKASGYTPGALDRLFSTHPLTQDRVNNVSAIFKSLKISADTTKGLFTQEYQQFKTLIPKK